MLFLKYSDFPDSFVLKLWSFHFDKSKYSLRIILKLDYNFQLRGY